MSIISANTLFHFTSTLDVLLKVLETGFRPSYSCEFGKATNGRVKESNIPMVCFCDLPLSTIEKHSSGYNWEYKGKPQHFKGYGKYGIGLSKDWGRRAQLNPVTYITNESQYLDWAIGLNSISSGIVKDTETWKTIDKVSPNQLTNRKKISDRQNASDSIKGKSFVMKQMAYSLFNFMKLYQNLQTGQRYYDEREWRFVPPIVGMTGAESHFFPALITSDFTDIEVEKNKFQDKLNNDIRNRLAFDANDIKYIIINKDDDIKALIELMEGLPTKYKKTEIKRLTSRILTSEQIHEDF